MNILLIITGLGMGGAETQVCNLADQFSELGHQVLLISMTGEIVNKPVSNSVQVVTLKMKKNLFGFCSAYLRANRLIKSFNPDVVHSHMVHANLFARLLRLSVRIPKLISTAHSSNEGGFIRMFAYRLTDPLCDLSTNVSQEAVDISVKRGAFVHKRIVAVHNGVDTERFRFNILSRKMKRCELGLSDDITLLLAVGRLTEAKDYPTLLKALRIVIQSGNKVKLAIIGTGEEQQKLSKMAVELGINDHIHFLGLRHDVHEWMSAADMFVLSSAWEGFGLVVAEAMSCERLVIATDCGGVKEVVGRAGILVSSKNTTALSQGLMEGLALSSDSVAEFGALARERIVELYSLRTQSLRWLCLYS
ncbi:glycosyltransferase [Shewanella litoralis]|uniref:Glycosyl transferase n=1 Tax=Shewanella litoralis TaxID=2282700 RepID=A0ABQ2RLB2_9GAMM|nr:glycosyltransferase [Shewanella litoralis]GGQ33944.1 glycosyl transferase [Shewanella litoralis]